MSAKTRVALAGRPGPIGRHIAAYLTARDWKVGDTGPLAGLIFDAGLLDGDPSPWATSISAFRSALREHLPHFADQAGGGARVVVLGSRDWLGAEGYAEQAAIGGGLVSAVRSLALEYGRRAITVNIVVGLPEHDPSTVEGLLPWPVTADDIAAATEFFLDRRSSYITGQVLYCCAGASLLSSLSA
ncbi:MAG TPA: SDR family oxidoreductase [Pseudonocardiaceae bacterium]|nr:SDR family oxidoreductase [Pseudonocardiaceae bacterium]